MLYELKFGSGRLSDEVELLHDNASDALDALIKLRECVRRVQILRDGVIITAKQLTSDAEIQTVRQTEENRLPATCQPGWGTDSDITTGHDGSPRTVRRLGNPEDNFE